MCRRIDACLEVMGVVEVVEVVEVVDVEVVPPWRWSMWLWDCGWVGGLGRVGGGDEEGNLAKKYDIEGYPTFLLLKGVKNRNTLAADKVIPYEGGRSREEIEDFIKSNEW